MKSGYLICLNRLCVYTTICIAIYTYSYIWLYINTSIRIDGHKPICYTCGALLFLTSMFHFVSGFDHSLSVS